MKMQSVFSEMRTEIFKNDLIQIMMQGDKPRSYGKSMRHHTQESVWVGQQLRRARETYRAIDKIRPVETDKKRVTNSV
jgi:hypothetical protein